MPCVEYRTQWEDDNRAKRNASGVPCECMNPGEYRTGIPGILGIIRGVIVVGDVERCDMCRRYDSADSAKAMMLALGFKIKTSE